MQRAGIVTAVELVHPVDVAEIEPWMAQLTTALLGAPWEQDFAPRVAGRRREWRPGRAWGARDRGRWIATLATEERTLTVPAGPGGTALLTVDALTAVSVAATHRRRGLLRSMIGSSLAAAVERGDAVSILIAAEWPIYGRFGYAPATRSATYTLHTRRPGATLSADPAGSVRQVEPAELARHAGAVFERSRRRWPGQVDRAGSWWSRRLGTDGFPALSTGHATWVLHEGEDGPDGLLGWRVTRDFDGTGELGAVDVVDLAAGSDRAYRNLWAYLCGLDVISEVTLSGRPVEEPVRWLLPDGRALHQRFTGDDVWLRLLDVPAALSARGYGVAGRLVLEVVDPDAGGFAAGRYLLCVDPDGARCTRTDAAAELRVPQRALAAAYLGDHSLRALAVAGGVDEFAPGALDRADAMFATPVRPWNATEF